MHPPRLDPNDVRLYFLGLRRMLWFGCLALVPVWGNAAELRGAREYETDVAPLLRKYCFECHGGGAREGGVALDEEPQLERLIANHKLWDQVQKLVACHVMPPVDADAPTREERTRIVKWIDDVVFYCDPARPDPGHVVLRRLNRAEYNNSVRDIFFVRVRPADSFPPDDSGYGFDNIGDVLNISPVLMDKYVRAARQVMDEALVITPPKMVNMQFVRGKPSRRLERFAGEVDVENPVLQTGVAIGLRVEVPQDSVYRVTVQGAGRSAGQRPVALEVVVDDQPVATLELTGNWDERWASWKPRSAFVDLKAGTRRVAFRLPAHQASSGAEPAADESWRAAISGLAIEGPFAPTRGIPSEFLKRLTERSALGPRMLTLSGEDFERVQGRQGTDTGSTWFAANGHCAVTIRVPLAGKYRFRVKAGAQQAGSEPARFEVRGEGRSLGTFAVHAKEQAAQWIEFVGDLPAGDPRLEVAFLNEFRDAGTGEERWLWFHEMKIEGPLEEDTGLAPTNLPDLVAKVGRLIFRRPLHERELNKLTALMEQAGAAGVSPLESLRLALETMLISPKFLFHPAPQPVGEVTHGSASIDEFTLASRLSFLFWSTTPDEELLRLAEQGTLRAQLRPQVTRLLADSRSEAFTRNFAGQWLQLRDVDLISTNRRQFPEFTRQLATDMRRESEMLFNHLLHENRSVIDFLNADYTFVNERLADHYGLEGVRGRDFRKVSLAGMPRGGILTHAGVLSLTSHPLRTSPVKRGKYILEQILGTPPPPAPGDAPPFKERGFDPKLTLRQRFEQHRENKACASCHAFLDPMGMALENYDPIGRWRERDGRQPVDAGGELITGQKFKNFEELRTLLVSEHRDDFLRSLCEQLLTYSLGRGLEYTDKLAVREIMRRATEDEFRFQTILVAVCESVPFQRMRVPEPMGVPEPMRGTE